MDGGVVLLKGVGLDDEGSWRAYCCTLSTGLEVEDVDGGDGEGVRASVLLHTQHKIEGGGCGW